MLRCWLAMGGKEETLRRVHGWKVGGESRDDVLEWWRIGVEGGRVTSLVWYDQGLTRTIPSKIGALSALRHLYLCNSALSGSILLKIGALTSLVELELSCNPLFGVVPSTLSNLTKLEFLDLTENRLTNAPTSNFLDKLVVQNYRSTLWRPQVLLFLNHGIAITKKAPGHPREAHLSSTRASRPPPLLRLPHTLRGRHGPHPVLPQPARLRRGEKVGMASAV